MTYSQWYHNYLTLYKRKIAAKTKESYARIDSLIEPLIGDAELTNISPDAIQAALVTVEEKAGSRQAQIAYALLHSVLARAVRSKHLQASPVDDVDKPEHEPKEGRVLEGEDWQALKPIISSSAAYSLMCYAGLRRGEALALQRADIDLQSGVIHITKQRLRVSGKITIKKPKSSAGIRDIPIDPELLPILTKATRYLLPSAFIVPIAPETLEHRWKKDQQKAGVRQTYRLHDLRHTYATRLALDGLPPRVLQYVMGHSSYRLTTKVYTHITARIAKESLAQIYKKA